LLAVSGAATEQESEVEALRARVAQLEQELAERTERANAALAAAQDRLYWIDRWRIDPNRVLGSRPGQVAYVIARQGRRAMRAAGRVRRRHTR
jgi:hypothetical protein